MLLGWKGNQAFIRIMQYVPVMNVSLAFFNKFCSIKGAATTIDLYIDHGKFLLMSNGDLGQPLIGEK